MRARPAVRRALRAASVAAGMSFLLAAPAMAQVEGSWEQYQGDAARTGVAAEAPDPPYEVTWEQQAGIGTPEDVTGSPIPIVVGELAIVVGRESVVAVDVTDGTEAWSADRALGPSTPAAAADAVDGTVIVVTEGGADADATPTAAPTPSGSPSAAASPSVDVTTSILLGLDAETGERLWETPLPNVSRTGAAIIDDRAFVGTDGGDVIAIDVATGDQLWSASAGDEVVLPLAAAGDLVLAPTSTSVLSATPELGACGVAEGDELWRYVPSATGVAVGSPAVGGDAAYVTLGDRTVEALALSDGSLLWSSSMNQSGVLTPVVVDDLVVTVDGLGQVFAFDAANGQRRWDHALNVSVFGPPVAVGDAIVVPGDDGILAALDPGSGELVFRASIADGFVLGLAATPERLVASVTGAVPGLLGISHDDEGTLVRVPSPTIPDLPVLLGTWVVAAVPLTLLLWFVGRWLWGSLAPLDFPSGEELEGSGSVSGPQEDAT